MKVLFEPKKTLEVSAVNSGLSNGDSYMKACEDGYHARIDAVADAVVAGGNAIVMLSGPSASGKTTSAYKIALALRRHEKKAVVVSLDNFFRNMADYPKTRDGIPDWEHVRAVDVDRVNDCLKELIDTGETEMPVYDFLTQRRTDETLHVEAGKNEIVIIEGIHALNPLLTESISNNALFKLYVGLRTEYSVDGKRVVATRDLRITRRLVRDYYFRGHSVRNTLELWKRLMDGEERWIKPFKKDADMLLDTSHPYEVGVFHTVLEVLCDDPEQGGEYRGILLTLAEQYEQFYSIEPDDVPKNSMLREFIGGLQL